MFMCLRGVWAKSKPPPPKATSTPPPKAKVKQLIKLELKFIR